MALVPRETRLTRFTRVATSPFTQSIVLGAAAQQIRPFLTSTGQLPSFRPRKRTVQTQEDGNQVKQQTKRSKSLRGRPIAKTMAVRVGRNRKNVEKRLISFHFNTVDSVSQAEQALINANFPCTAGGISLDLVAHRESSSSGNSTSMGWALIINRGGQTNATISLGAGTTFFEPEENVLLSGVFSSQGVINDSTYRYIRTKTMRKLQSGDRLMFIAKGNGPAASNDAWFIRGTLTMFCTS